MTERENPFRYDTAKDLSREDLLDFYIEDYNYSRFIQSTRNVFLVGERGSGKTMTLLFNSLPIQQRKAENENKPFTPNRIGVYIPCNTPLTHKEEYRLLNPFKAAVVSEHYLILEIIYRIANTLRSISDLLSDYESSVLQDDVAYIMGFELDAQHSFFESIERFVQRETIATQRHINSKDSDSFYENALSFGSAVLPLIRILKTAEKLSNSHFLLMIDDAHDLNDFQLKALNSWVAYRDHIDFSFKIASAKVEEPSHITSTGGTILEGHDFIRIDMEQPFQNRHSDFAKMADLIVKRRLKRIGTTTSAYSFFPINPQLEKDLEHYKEQARKEGKKKYPHGTQKQINDYVYKYSRVLYFRDRSPKANLPPYSGFDTLIHLSTGVVRNLLEPCYWMYDKMISESGVGGDLPVELIPPEIQSEVILDRSRRMWERLESGLDRSIVNCSRDQAIQLYNLFDRLASLFRKRLLHHNSEPRAISFTISGLNPDSETIITDLLDIARKAQLLYTRTSTAKDEGGRETYYVPNRMLWPFRGLDPIGQHARVSLKAKDVLAAALHDTPFPDSLDIDTTVDLFSNSEEDVNYE